MMLIPGALVFLFGRMMIKNGKHIHAPAYVLFGTMLLFFFVCFVIALISEYQGNVVLAHLGVIGVNMEGKEVRFGPGMAALV
ncbi:potassium-transporting ATPase subunit KdpA, partial [Staphylococcus pseudintermedius]|uniref:potassium-transporting ATPase subunit KdpA n=1 Tax=Staphylococcus pseudintermedius TaxID=283734 RepID=UPI003F68ADF2